MKMFSPADSWVIFKKNIFKKKAPEWLSTNQNVQVNVVFWGRQSELGLRYTCVSPASSCTDRLLQSRCALVQRSRLALMLLTYLTLNTLCSNTPLKTLQRHEAIQRPVDEGLKPFQGSDCGSGQWHIYDATTHIYGILLFKTVHVNNLRTNVYFVKAQQTVGV